MTTPPAASCASTRCIGRTTARGTKRSDSLHVCRIGMPLATSSFVQDVARSGGVSRPSLSQCVHETVNARARFSRRSSCRARGCGRPARPASCGRGRAPRRARRRTRGRRATSTRQSVSVVIDAVRGPLSSSDSSPIALPGPARGDLATVALHASRCPRRSRTSRARRRPATARARDRSTSRHVVRSRAASRHRRRERA